MLAPRDLLHHVVLRVEPGVAILGSVEEGGDDDAAGLEDDVVGRVCGGDVIDAAGQDDVQGPLHLGVLVQEGRVHVMNLAPDDAIEVHVEVGLVL